MEIKIKKNVMGSNKTIAEKNKNKFLNNNILAVNIMGSPGSGKTSFLEATLDSLIEDCSIGVIEGDLATDRDAERIAAFGIPVTQINTLGGCHLDARMIEGELVHFNLESLDLLIIENVGNLVCPAAFDLGEDFKVVILSVAEGGDKPVKYPRTFLEAEAVVINKIDLLPYTDVDLEILKQDLLQINSKLKIFEVSCREKKGLDQWNEWFKSKIDEKRMNKKP